MLEANLSVVDNADGFKVLERLAQQEGMRIARELLTKHISQLEEQIHSARASGVHVVGWRSRRLQTLVGEIEIRRRYYVDAEGNRFYLLDKHLGLEPGRRVSTSMEQIAVTLSCEHTYRGSVDLIEQLLGVRIEAQTAHAAVQRMGSKAREALRQEVEALSEARTEPEPGELKASVLVVEADGVNVRLQREGRKKSIEIKHGVAYDGWESKGERVELNNRLRYATVAASEQFWEEFGLEISRTWDLGAVKRVVIGGDGAEWVKRGLQQFVGSEFQLDAYHTRKRIGDALQDGECARSVFELVQKGDTKTAVTVLKAIAAADKTKARACADLSRWIEQNAAELQDYRLRPGELPDNARGTGAIESNNDKYIANRFKKRGRGWTIAGLQNLLALKNRVDAREQLDARKPMPMLRPLEFANLFAGVDANPNWFKAKMPALDHAKSKPWTRMLRNISGGGLPTNA